MNMTAIEGGRRSTRAVMLNKKTRTAQPSVLRMLLLSLILLLSLSLLLLLLFSPVLSLVVVAEADADVASGDNNKDTTKNDASSASAGGGIRTTTPTLTRVQATSVFVAYLRHLETKRNELCGTDDDDDDNDKKEDNNKDRTAGPLSCTPALIVDDYAKVLFDRLVVGDHQSAIEEWNASPMLLNGVNMMGIRTRFIDDWLRMTDTDDDGTSTTSTLDENNQEVDEDDDTEDGYDYQCERQVVNLGAGMCTRPYRLKDLKCRTTFFEVEQDKNVLQVKRNVLESHESATSTSTTTGKMKEDTGTTIPRRKNHVIDVQADVTNIAELAGGLLDAGFDPDIPTDWVLEGLLEYVPLESHEQIFRMAAQLSKDSITFSSSKTTPSRILVWNGEPWVHKYVRMYNISFPHVGFRTVSSTVTALNNAGWTHNLTVHDDDYFWNTYKRAMNFPMYIVTAELSSNDDDDDDDDDDDVNNKNENDMDDDNNEATATAAAAAEL